jgi:hypothetical protein
MEEKEAWTRPVLFHPCFVEKRIDTVDLGLLYELPAQSPADIAADIDGIKKKILNETKRSPRATT